MREIKVSGGPSEAAYEVAAVDADGNREIKRCRSLTTAFGLFFGAELSARWQAIEVVETATGERVAAASRCGCQYWR